MEKDRKQRAHIGVPHGNALRSVFRTHPAQEVALVAKQFQRLDDYRVGEHIPLEHRLTENPVEHWISQIQGSRRNLLLSLGILRQQR